MRGGEDRERRPTQNTRRPTHAILPVVNLKNQDGLSSTYVNKKSCEDFNRWEVRTLDR